MSVVQTAALRLTTRHGSNVKKFYILMFALTVMANACGDSEEESRIVSTDGTETPQESGDPSGDVINYDLGEELQAGVVYEGGTIVTIREEGVWLKVPTGWGGAASGISFVMTKEGTDGVLMVLLDRGSLDEMSAYLSTVQNFEDGSSYKPVGEITRDGNIASILCQIVEDGQTYDAVAQVKATEYGRVVLVLSVYVTEAAKQETLAAGDAVFESLKLGKPLLPEPGDATGPFADVFPNKRLKHISSGGGSSDSSSFNFCADGTFDGYGSTSSYSRTDFVDITSDQMSSVEASGVSSGAYAGTWAVKGEILYLLFDDGGFSKRTVTKDEDGALFIDGIRYFRDGTACD